MEAFAPLPVSIFAESYDNNDNSRSNGSNNNRTSTNEAAYLSLSQLDFELQQQAQAALLQDDVWQDFDKYLPMDNELLNPINNSFSALTANNPYNNEHSLVRNREAESIFATPSTATPATAGTAQSINSGNYFNVAGSAIVYEPLSDLLSSSNQQQPIVASQQPASVHPTNPNSFNSNMVTTATSSNTLPAHICNWNSKKADNNIKQEYASPESLPYSPPQHFHSSLSLSPPLSHSQQHQLFQFPDLTTSISDSTKRPTIATTSAVEATATTAPVATTTAVSAMPAASWNPSVTVTPSIDGTQDLYIAKLPIQRLRTTANNVSNNNSASGNSSLGGGNNQPTTGRQHKKTAHNAIERRYRNNINDRIAELKNAVPALLYAKVKDNRSSNNSNKRPHKGNEEEEDDGEDGEEYLDGVAVATKLNKATILRKATEYILHLKKTSEDIRQENQTLQQILTQLPGGVEVLKQYLTQKEQREKMLQQEQQRLHERENAKRQTSQQRNSKAAASRKRAKYGAQHAAGDQEGYDSSSSGSPTTPETPPLASNISNRVFMALFMCITFFSTSPLTSGGPNYNDQYRNHHHTSKANSIPSSTTSSNNNNDPPLTHGFDASQMASLKRATSVLGSFFNMSDGWSMLRNVVFVLCLIHIFFPFIKSLIQSSLRLKRVHRFKQAPNARRCRRGTGTVGGHVKEKAITAGELKCEKTLSILTKSLKAEGQVVFEGDTPTGGGRTKPRHSSNFMLVPLLRELFLTVCHHFFGVEIMLGQRRNDDNDTPEEVWNRVCLWVKLNELQCVNGTSRLTMLYSCCRMINLVDTLDNDDIDSMGMVGNAIAQLCSRAYATVALEVSLNVPNKYIAQRLAQYFWNCAVNSSKYHNGGFSGNTEMEGEGDIMTEECNMWMQSFSWFDPDLIAQRAEDADYDVYDSRAWRETCDILQNQSNSCARAGQKPTSVPNNTLSLSYNAPVMIPLAILSNLHLLDNLRIQFDKLVAMFACRQDDKYDEDDQTEDNNNMTAFFDIILLTEESDAAAENSLRLVNWLATVGYITECLWSGDIDEAEKYLPSLIQRIPRSMSCKASSAVQKEAASQMDEALKKFMVHILVGSALVRNTKDQQKQKQGLEELEHAEALRELILKLQARLRSFTDGVDTGDALTNNANESLENIVLTQAEFVVLYISLESWIKSLHLLHSNDVNSTLLEKASYYEEQINETTLYLRRLIGSAALQNVNEIESVIERLSKLSRFITYLGDADSACDLTDEDDFYNEDEEFEVGDDDSFLGTLPRSSTRSNHEEQSPAKIAGKAQLILRGHL